METYVLIFASWEGASFYKVETFIYWGSLGYGEISEILQTSSSDRNP